MHLALLYPVSGARPGSIKFWNQLLVSTDKCIPPFHMFEWTNDSLDQTKLGVFFYRVLLLWSASNRCSIQNYVCLHFYNVILLGVLPAFCRVVVQACLWRFLHKCIFAKKKWLKCFHWKWLNPFPGITIIFIALHFWDFICSGVLVCSLQEDFNRSCWRLHEAMSGIW